MWLAVFTALSNSTVRRKNEGSQGAETPETGGGNSGNMYFGMHTPGTPEASELLLLERRSGLLCCPRRSGLQLPLAHALLDRSDRLGLKVGGSAVEVGVGDNTVRVLGDRQGSPGKGGREGRRKGRWTKRGGARDENDEKETRKRRACV